MHQRVCIAEVARDAPPAWHGCVKQGSKLEKSNIVMR